MITNLLSTNVSQLSLDSLDLGSHEETDDTAVESSQSETKAQPIARRRFQSIRQAIADIRQSRISLKFWPLFTLVFFGVFILVFRLWGSTLIRLSSSACSTDGSFRTIAYDLNVWTASDFFQINLAIGDLSFTQAKLIDTAWDLGIGRGGQAILSLITWKVLADYVALSMTIQPVTFATYRTIFTEGEPSILSTWRLLYDFIKHRGLASRLASAFVIYSMTAILAWPTLASSATGYSPITQAFVRNYDGNLIPFTGFRPVGYIIHDAWRINDTLNNLFIYLGCQSDASIQDPSYQSYGTGISRYSGVGQCYSNEQYLPYDDQWTPEDNGQGYFLQQDVSNYVEKFGFYGLSNQSSSLFGSRIDPPTLNIEAFYLPPFYGLYGLYGMTWTDPRENGTRMPFNNVSKLTWENSNQTYQLKDLEHRGVCLPVKDRFQWGASFLQIFILFVVLLIWAIGCLVFWIWSHPRLQFPEHMDPPKGYQALAILVECFNEHLSDGKPTLSQMADQEANTKIQKHLSGGHMRFNPSVQTQTFRVWCRREWLWLLIWLLVFGATLGFLLATFGANTYRLENFLTVTWGFSSSFIISEGLLFALVVGKTPGSKLVLILCWTLSSVPTGLAVFLATTFPF